MRFNRKAARDSFRRYVPRSRPRGSFGMVLATVFTVVLAIVAIGSWLASPAAGRLGLGLALGPTATLAPGVESVEVIDPNTTPLPRRGPFGPGEHLPYVIQSGDTVPVLAVHFNTSADEILAANPQLAATGILTPGLTIEIPSYYFPLTGPTYQMVPDSAFVYGPGALGFDVEGFLASTSGTFKNLSAFAGGQQRTAAQTLAYVAQQYSINPTVFLALAEWRTGAVTQVIADDQPYGWLPAEAPDTWYLQTLWLAERMSAGYYGWRDGTLTTFMLAGDYTSRIDMYQNAATVGLQSIFALLDDREAFELAAGPRGYGATYRALFGDPWEDAQPTLTAGLTQPPMQLPFAVNRVWTLTGGPHPIWGRLLPWGAIDFAPAGVSGCGSTDDPAVAVADGVIARSGENIVMLDLDGDGNEQTGWVVMYLHLAKDGIIPAGTRVSAGDPLGYPSCEGGSATGTHVHMGRRYNGEWLAADGVVPFDLGGWVAQHGALPYSGRLVRLGAWVEASTVSTTQNRIYWVAEDEK